MGSVADVTTRSPHPAAQASPDVPSQFEGSPMKIAVLGAGNVGVPLAKAFAADGHAVKLANSRGPETLRQLAPSLGVSAAWAVDAVRDVDVIITTVNLKSYEAIRPLLDAVPDDVPLIDTGNYHPYRDGQIAAIDDGQLEARWISEQLGRPVTKAWNAVLAQTLAEKGLPAGTPGRIALPVAGDDPEGRRLAATLTDITGFDSVDIGGLDNSWRAHPGTAAYCTELPREALREAIERADAAHAPLRRDLCWQAFQAFGDALNRENVVRFHRAITLTPDPR
jgi:predicted dinucleotide-binding enzyme